jgi:hypothetical protein
VTRQLVRVGVDHHHPEVPVFVHLGGIHPRVWRRRYTGASTLAAAFSKKSRARRD